MATRRQRGAVRRTKPTTTWSRAASSAPGPPDEHERVDPLGDNGERRGTEDEPALGADGGATRRGQGHPVAPCSPQRPGGPGRPGEDLVRPDGVERLEAVEGDDHDVAFLHGSHSAGRRGWRQ